MNLGRVRKYLIGLSLLIVSAQFSNAFQSNSIWSQTNIAEFETELESLRTKVNIPGFSVGIVHDGQLQYKRGFGVKDLETKERPDEHTVYHTASITKTFGAIMLMTLVEEGKINLEDPVRMHGIKLPGKWGDTDKIQIQHLLSHTAQGKKPGYKHRYNGDWYHSLGNAFNSVSDKSFAELVIEKVIKPLDMTNTAPSLDDTAAFEYSGLKRTEYSKLVAKPYEWNKKELTVVEKEYNFGPAAGLMSSVNDLAKYSIAIDQQKWVSEESWNKMLSPFKTPKGEELIYGLGWFTKPYGGHKMIWHTGWWLGYSSLFLKIPELDLTFIILSNSQDVSRPFYSFMGGKSLHKDLMASDFAKLFIESFTQIEL